MKEKIKLKDVAIHSKGKQINGSDLVEDGMYDYLNGGINPSGKWNEYNTNGCTVTISEGGNSSGYVNYMEESFWCGAHCYFLSGVKGNPKYLYFALKSKQEQIMNLRTGATMPNIKKSVLGEFEFTYDSSLKEQDKVVSVLERIEKIISYKNEQLHDLDNLIKSRFVEMFGDPISNLNNYVYKSIGEVTKSITAGWSANGEARIKQQHEKAVLKVSAVTQGFFKPDEYKVIDVNEPIKKYVFPQKGDLLFSRANTREMVGATAIIEQDYPDLFLPDKLWKILFENTVNVYYMKFILSTPAIRAEFSVQSTGTSGSMYNVSMDKFKGIGIPIPPIELQNQFATFVHQVDKLKIELQKSLDETQMLFDSLMQKYFA